MTDLYVAWLRRDVARVFGGTRQIAVLEDRGGRLIPVGDPTSSQIACASMLLASVHLRLPRQHSYASASIPRAALLRGVPNSDRGSILIAPLFEDGVAIGVVVVEGLAGQAFTPHDLTCLEALTSAEREMPSHA